MVFLSDLLAKLMTVELNVRTNDKRIFIRKKNIFEILDFSNFNRYSLMFVYKFRRNCLDAYGLKEWSQILNKSMGAIFFAAKELYELKTQKQIASQCD